MEDGGFAGLAAGEDGLGFFPSRVQRREQAFDAIDDSILFTNRCKRNYSPFYISQMKIGDTDSRQMFIKLILTNKTIYNI